MNIMISPISEIPIYEQIREQVTEQILSGKIPPGTQLPSIRMLAKECKIGIITVKRAYEELCKSGIAVSINGKGVYAAELDAAFVKNSYHTQLKEQLKDVYHYAKTVSFSDEEFMNLVRELVEEESI